MKKFTDESMQEILAYLKNNKSSRIEVLNPDISLSAHAGEKIKLEGEIYI